MVGTAWDLELAEALMTLNARRAVARAAARDALEREVEERFGASRRLAVYGSLAPGEVNHHAIADLPGTWEDAIVTGVLQPPEPGSTSHFPALRWRAGGPPVAARLFVSDALPAQWGRLDAFEGTAYRRILVPVHSESGALIAVANLYADATDG
ncbi:MAG TPA: gamma-glutamylcyclotransferase family protein [Gemmatimonadales bacterium]|nr:gamma-glutamylcyclotransferase family protein [Gemmatimonadales bacterium]